jgi:hypothetical protein
LYHLRYGLEDDTEPRSGNNNQTIPSNRNKNQGVVQDGMPATKIVDGSTQVLQTNAYQQLAYEEPDLVIQKIGEEE